MTKLCCCLLGLFALLMQPVFALPGDAIQVLARGNAQYFPPGFTIELKVAICPKGLHGLFHCMEPSLLTLSAVEDAADRQFVPVHNRSQEEPGEYRYHLQSMNTAVLPVPNQNESVIMIGYGDRLTDQYYTDDARCLNANVITLHYYLVQSECDGQRVQWKYRGLSLTKYEYD